MSTGVACERRDTCANNLNGVCQLAEPRIDRRSAYASCLDQKLPIAAELTGTLGLSEIGTTPIGGV